MNILTRAFDDIVARIRTPDSAEGDDSQNGEQRKKLTVLAIDDDAAFLETVAYLLKSAGYNVVTTTSVEQGLELVQDTNLDVSVVLLDYNIPKHYGPETLRLLCRLNPIVKVIAITGVNIAKLPPSFRIGVDKYLQKPFKGQELIGCLNSFLKNDGARDNEPAAAY